MADDNGWVSDDDLDEAMKMQDMVYGSQYSRTKVGKASAAASMALAKNLFKQNSASAATQICNLAQHGANEKIKFEASKYILERALGPTNNPLNDGDEPLEKTLAALLAGNDDDAANS